MDREGAEEGCNESTVELLIEEATITEQVGVDEDPSQQLIIFTDGNDVNSHSKVYDIVPNSSTGSIMLGDGVPLATLDAGGDAHDPAVELVQIAPFGDISGDNKVWQYVPSNMNIAADSVVIMGDRQQAIQAAGPAGDGGPTQFGLVNTSLTKMPPLDAPQWAKVINDCEKVGHYYRGWVPTEQDLDIVLALHKQQTNSFWGTRQSPDSSRPSARMMWKSQYVPFDGIPFINCGSRATVMECQFGPRRCGTKLEVTSSGAPDFKHSCPARIYVKKVRKFPDFAIPTNLKKRELKQMMDRSFSALKCQGFTGGGDDRYYMQLPTVNSHEYHNADLDVRNSLITRTYDVSGSRNCGSTRLAEPVANKIRDIVASGIHHTTTIRKMLRKYVEKDLFDNEEPPVRHDLSYFPTVSDLKNHVHTALGDIANGTLPLTEATMHNLAMDQDHVWTSGWVSSLAPQPETVTVTLTQTGENAGHIISRVETHMSNGTVRVSPSLTMETASLLARLHPNMFPNIQSMVHGEQLDGEKITELVQSVLLKSTVKIGTSDDGAADEDSRLDSSSITDSRLEEPPEPPLPTEGVQLDLELHDATHDVTEVTLDGETCHESCAVELTV